MMSDQPTFHLGITLAGAVSAGCYTAGVLDYLFETFDLWEQAKAGSLEGIQNTALVPRHNVVIEAIGGASAGGMCASMAVLHAMNPQRKPVSTPLNTPQKRNNIFYDSWVLLDDDQRETFAKLMDVSDLQSGKVTSLLNSKPIDSIAERAFQVSGALRLDTLPAYIASDLEVLLSVTMLRGLPLEVDFRTPIRARAKKGRYSPSHITWEHYTLAHFKLSDADARRKGYLWLNPFDAEARALMLKCTIATGAFPIGLKFRKFEASDFPVDYLKEVAERIVFSRFGDEAHHTDIEQVREQIRMEFQPLELPKKSQDKLERLLDGLPGSANELANYAADKMDSAENVVAALSDLPDHIDWERLKDDFSFTAVDGGVINNEPFGEVLKLIKNKFEHENENEHQSYGVIMVDPFPDRMDREKSEQDEPYKHPDDLFGVAGKLIKTLKNQSRVKRDEMVMEREDDYIKGVIYPVRWDAFEENGQQRYKPNPWPIACESFDAFGGFLDVKFREYDFFLGRDNARNFLNYFFSLPADGELHPIHKAWTPQMVETFKIVVNGKTFLPIIPDVRRLIDPSYIGAGAQYAYTLPNRPSLRPSDVLKHRGAMERRIEQIIKTAKRSLMSPDDTSETLHPIASKAIKKAYKTPFMKRPMEALKKGIFRGILYLAPGALAKMASKSVMNYILSDLEDKNLLVEE